MCWSICYCSAYLRMFIIVLNALIPNAKQRSHNDPHLTIYKYDRSTARHINYFIILDMSFWFWISFCIVITIIINTYFKSVRFPLISVLFIIPNMYVMNSNFFYRPYCFFLHHLFPSMFYHTFSYIARLSVDLPFLFSFSSKTYHSKLCEKK